MQMRAKLKHKMLDQTEAKQNRHSTIIRKRVRVWNTLEKPEEELDSNSNVEDVEQLELPSPPTVKSTGQPLLAGNGPAIARWEKAKGCSIFGWAKLFKVRLFNWTNGLGLVWTVRLWEWMLIRHKGPLKRWPSGKVGGQRRKECLAVKIPLPNFLWLPIMELRILLVNELMLHQVTSCASRFFFSNGKWSKNEDHFCFIWDFLEEKNSFERLTKNSLCHGGG